jgi:hypothetical protein
MPIELLNITQSSLISRWALLREEKGIGDEAHNGKGA